MGKVLRLGFLVSGRGSNLQAILQACRDGRLKATPAVVISNNTDSGALALARDAALPAYHLSSKTHPDPKILDRTITAILQKHEVDLVVLAGYMKKLGPITLRAYRNRILNIHPSLLPNHGGQGMYGMAVHEAVLRAGEKETGATVHLVDGEYDTGRILAQRRVPVRRDDTAAALAARVLETEHELYVEVLRGIIDGEIKLPVEDMVD
ncbi:MAG: phosphoribosylglycinamide formyltransferase [Gammaproteobacteria bacterium]